MLIFEIITTIYFTFYIKQIPMLNYPGGIVKTFSDIAMIPSFCVMCALFLFFKQRECWLETLSAKTLLAKGASLTFGIYLIHPFLITYLLDPFNKFLVDKFLVAFPLIVRIIVDPLVIYFASGIITLYIRKIKYLKWLMP